MKHQLKCTKILFGQAVFILNNNNNQSECRVYKPSKFCVVINVET